MAGRPRERGLNEALESRTRLMFALEPNAETATQLDYVVEWQAGGQTLNQLAEELEVDPQTLMRYLARTYGKETVKQRLKDAREDGADRLAEKALHVANQTDPENVNADRLRVSTLQWTAEQWNRREYGRNPQAVTVNIGSLFLDALRVRSSDQGTAGASEVDAIDGRVRVQTVVPQNARVGILQNARPEAAERDRSAGTEPDNSSASSDEIASDGVAAA